METQASQPFSNIKFDKLIKILDDPFRKHFAPFIFIEYLKENPHVSNIDRYNLITKLKNEPDKNLAQDLKFMVDLWTFYFESKKYNKPQVLENVTNKEIEDMWKSLRSKTFDNNEEDFITLGLYALKNNYIPEFDDSSPHYTLRNILIMLK